MHRTEGLNYIVESGKNLFTEGPPGTMVMADWLNAVQEELCNVIESAGMVVNDDGNSDTWDQLLQAIQLIGRASSVEPGTEMLTYADVAPIGWILRTSVDDVLGIITKGSSAGGHPGGTAHPTGTWQNPDHTVTEGELPIHDHYIPYTQVVPNVGSGSGYLGRDPARTSMLDTGAVGGGGVHNHGNAWRPKAECFIICIKATL